jgi:hypothetical protein
MRRLATVAAAGAIVAVVLATTTAGGQAPPGRTLVLTELAKGGTFGLVDNPPRSRGPRRGFPARLSPGDIEAFSSVLANAQGQRVGRIHVGCVVTVGGRPSNSAATCTGALRLNDGLITVVAPVIGTPTTIAATITGGTGNYEGARGDFTTVSHRNGTSTDTLHLLP